MDKNIISIKQLTTPLGLMYMGATKDGLCLLDFCDGPKLENTFKQLIKCYNATLIHIDEKRNSDNPPIHNPHLTQTEHELKDYFTGQRQQFSVALDIKGTVFQQKVWHALMTIPYGETCSYQAQAKHIEQPKAVRAVANTNGMNRISIIIPCHRVIGANGTLTGYTGGLWRKAWLLEHEKNHTTEE
ncbi:methylated-DNA--[protein]-cysteine S-methyltransferase [Orbaceae bacterium ESL0727]|nr:methylated-DNA--[protein]-cysteine S-methyltransferase [Orbaceae bacterium ESL0727]